jgi:hypothetical protein
MVYDRSIRLPGCDWTDDHTAQGFARRESVVNFRTLLEFGYADVRVSRSLYQPQPGYQRIIAVPFLVVSGKVAVEGPEETSVERDFTLAPGYYRLVATQRAVGDNDEVIDLYFEPHAESLEHSVILLADDELRPPTPLIETAKVAGE